MYVEQVFLTVLSIFWKLFFLNYQLAWIPSSKQTKATAMVTMKLKNWEVAPNKNVKMIVGVRRTVWDMTMLFTHRLILVVTITTLSQQNGSNRAAALTTVERSVTVVCLN